MLVMPIDRRFKVDARRIGVEHHILIHTAVRRQAVHGANTELDFAIRDRFKRFQLCAIGQLHFQIVVDVPVVPSVWNIFAEQEGV